MLHRLAGLLAVLVAMASPASAMDWLKGDRLESDCLSLLDDPQASEGVSCKAFIQGFLAGAEVTDGLVAERVKTLYRTGDSYVDRAAQTRVGMRLKQYGATSLAGYCIDADVGSEEVIGKVIAHFKRLPGEPELTAGAAVYQALVAGFPCGE